MEPRLPRVQGEQGCSSPDFDVCNFITKVKGGYLREECTHQGCTRWRSHLMPAPQGEVPAELVPVRELKRKEDRRARL